MDKKTDKKIDKRADGDDERMTVSGGAGFRRVTTIGTWRKFSLVLWANPQEAVRVLPPIEIRVGGAADALERRKRQRPDSPLTWTSVMLRAMTLLLAKHPEWNRFVRKNHIYERTNVDALLRVNLEDGSLWACYIRGAQTKTAEEFRTHVENHRAKIRDRGARYPVLARIVDWLPVSLLRGAYRFYDGFENRTGIAAPGMPDLRYPSFSLSNLGSLGSVLIPPLVTRGLHAPIHFTMGAVAARGDGATLPMIFAFDHRIIDAGGVGLLLSELEKILAEESFLAEVRG